MLKDFRKNLVPQGFRLIQHHSKSKKNDRPGAGTPKRSGETNPKLKLMFQPPLTIISHGVWLCHTHFQKVQVI